MTDLKSKKVAILGWGIDTEDIIPYLITNSAQITVYDRKTNLNTKYIQSSHITWKLGSDDFGDLAHFDLIIRNPAIYRFRSEIVAAEQAGVKISSKTKMFFDLCPCPIIGVTGTKGKGTTSTLIYKILQAGGKDVYLGGNIGVGMFDFLDKLTLQSWVVLELSSFQLIDLHKSPHIAVVLMTTSEHQDWHVNEAEYVDAKANIVKYQSPNDYCIVADDYQNSRTVAGDARSLIFKYSTLERRVPGCYLKNDAVIYNNSRPEEIIALNRVRLRGRHNLENIMAALTVGKILNIGNEVISSTIANFAGLEHRLEEVKTVGGTTYYNDSFSTTPETTIAAIKAFSEPLILIAGGSEKGSDFTALGKEIVKASNIKAVILIGLMAQRIKQAILVAGGSRVPLVEGLTSMEQIVTEASDISTKGDVVVLSPGAASFDMFTNYKDRGKQFKESVKRLAESG